VRHFVDAVLGPVLAAVGEWSLRWAALIGLLALGLAVFRPRRAATRHLLCLCVLLAGLLLPAVPTWGPGVWAPGCSPPEAAPMPPPAGKAEGPPPTFASPAAEAIAAEDVAAPAGVPQTPEPWGVGRLVVLTLTTLWCCGALLLLARWAAGWAYLCRLRRSAAKVGDEPARLFTACREELGLRRRVALATHPAVASPVTLGFLRPLVLVPPGWAELPAAAQRAALLHELAHLARWDDRLVPLLELLRAVFYFHLPLHWLLGRLERERELLCDEAAVAHGAEPRELARALLRFASCPGRLLPAPLAFGKRRTIKVRIHHLLEDDMERSTSPLPFRRGVAAGVFVVSLGLGLASLRLWAAAPAADEAPPADKHDSPPEQPRFPKEALRYGGKSFEQWRTELLTELKPAVRVDGMMALATFGVNGYGAEATAAVLELMRGYDVNTQYADDKSVVNAACEAVDKIGSPALPALRAGLKDRSRNVRRFAAAMLSHNSVWAGGSVPELFAALRDRDSYVRCDAVNALALVKPRPKGYLTALRERLKDGDSRVRNAAVANVGNLGPAARAAVPALLDIFDNDAPPLRVSALQALTLIKPDAQVLLPALTRAVQEPKRGVEIHAVLALAELGPSAAGAVPALTAALVRHIKERDQNGAEEIVKALGRIGPAAREAVPLLKQIGSLWGLRRAVAQALKEIEK
jgi:beta-lactamase regulating signal transducer with metallopeptidase domain/HEAT repeat protein